MSENFKTYLAGNAGDIAALPAAQKHELAIRYAKEIPHSHEGLSDFEAVFAYLCEIGDTKERRDALLELALILPSHKPFEGLFITVYSKALTETLTHEDAIHRKSSLFRLVDAIPDRPVFVELYARAIELTIEACDKIDDKFSRRYALADLGERIKHRPEYEGLLLFAHKTSLGMTGRSDLRKYSLEEISKELPKSCDVEVYRSHTFLGTAFSLPRRGAFLELLKDALKIAIEAAGIIPEPYYRKYALLFLANKLDNSPEFFELQRDAFNSAFKAIDALYDPFAKQYGFNEFLKLVPKTKEYASLIVETIDKSLPFFSLRSHLSDLEPVEVLDYIIVADEKKMNDSKKKRYIREHYSDVFAKEVGLITKELRDIRILESLKPYTHAWVRPASFREMLKKICSQLESLKNQFHGCEIERPLYVSETCYGIKSKGNLLTVSPATSSDTIAIDLGATNTVVMHKKGAALPQYVDLKGLSRVFGNVVTVPTAIDTTNNVIGVDALAHSASLNMKKLLLEGDKKGAEIMEQFFAHLFQSIKETASNPGWFKKLTGKVFDRICVTVPVGFDSYSNALKEIIGKSTGSSELLFVEEPLAAALGYRVAEKRDKFIAVVDFGGCTLDTMIIRLNTDEVHVVAKPERSRMLGGRDIDHWLASRLNDILKNSASSQPLPLLLEAERIKIALSEQESVSFEWNGSKHGQISRDDFESILAEHGFYTEVDRELTNVLKKAARLGVYKEMLEAVIITGGTSQIPSFKEKIAHFFPELAAANTIYDHSPLSAVATGAALYGTTGVIDPHLAMAYAVKHHIPGTDKNFAYEIVMEKGERLPFEKTYKIAPARTLGLQKEFFIELFEVPDHLITRRWIADGGMEFIRQIVAKTPDELSLRAFKTISLSFDEPQEHEVEVSFSISESGNLKIMYGKDRKEIKTGIKLQ